MVGGDYGFEFFSEVSSVCRAVAIGSYCDLEAASFNDGGDEEVAIPGVVNCVAENFELLSVLVYLFVQIFVVGSGDDQSGACEVLFFVFGFDELDIFLLT